MAVHIRLSRHGTKKSPFYRIVVTDHRSPRDGRFIENIGTFHPAGPFEIDRARLEYWRAQGAAPSDTLTQLLKKHPAPAAVAPAAPASA
jgi:small subunit ribosomal protein S16